MTVNLKSPQTELAYQRLKSGLVSGHLPAGKALRLEALQSDFSVGATPLRQALNKLEIERFVELRPNKGFFATPLTVDDFADITFSRQVIERALLTRAIERGDDEWEARLVQSFHLLKKCKIDLNLREFDKISKWNNRHVAFHTTLLSGSGSRSLLATYSGLFEHIQRHQMALMMRPRDERENLANHGYESVETMNARTSIDDHARLMEATLDRDSVAAAALMEEHIKLTPQKTIS